MISVLAELLLNGLSLLFRNVADLLAGLAAFEDAGRIFSELQIDDVGGGG